MNKLHLCFLFALYINSCVFGQLTNETSFNCCGYPVKAIDISPINSTESLFAQSAGCMVQVWGIDLNGAFLKKYNLDEHKDDVTSIAFSSDGYTLVSGSNDHSIKVWNLILRKSKLTLNGHSAPVNDLDISQDGKWIVSAGKDGKVVLWNGVTGEKIREVVNDEVAVTAVRFNSNDSLLAIGFSDGKLKIWNQQLNQFTIETRLHNEGINSILFKEKENILISASSDHSIKIFDINQKKIIQNLTGHTGKVNTLSLKVNDAQQLVLLSGSEDETIKFWNLSTGSELKSIHVKSEILALSNLNTSKEFNHLILSGSDDKKIRFYDINELETKAELSTYNGVPFLKTSENYFYTSQHLNSAPFFLDHLSKEQSSYLTEFIYNRPDLVFDELGIFSELSGKFKKTYSNRLLLNNMDTTIFDKISTPQITLKGEVPNIIDNKVLSLELEIKDRTLKLTDILIEVNGVVESRNIKDLNKLIYQGKQSVQLSNGKNTITVSASNEKGIKSEEITLEVYYNGPKQSENLYILSVGISKYKKAEYNLKYASKDAEKIIDLFKDKGTFSNVYSTLIMDSLASKENVLAFKNQLSKSTVDDAVIIYYSGYGLLSKNLDFYLGTYHMDFDSPEVDNLLYADLIDILKDIPARKRMVLLDADSFDFIDKDDVNSMGGQVDESIKFRGVEISLNSQNKSIQTKSYYPKPLDNDAIVTITASAANEVIYEKNEYPSGLFYFGLSSVINDTKSDTDNDEIINLNELYLALNKEIVKLSGRQQNPSLINSKNANYHFFKSFSKVDNKPPSITIIEPNFANRGGDVEVVQTEKFIIKGAIYDDSEIKYLKINNEKVELNSDGGFADTLVLEIGENIIDVLTEDIFGNIVSKKYTLMNNYKGPVIKGNYYALVIGVADYKLDELDLDFPVQDAKKLKDVLVKYYTFEEENINLLENPTRVELFDAFTSLENNLNEHDNLLIFYAGHGAMKENADQGYWLPNDATKTSQANWVTNDDIVSMIKPIKAKHILLISDACFSGKMFYKMRDINDNESVSIQENDQMKSRRAITSGALETVPDKSVFIEYLTDYLSQNKEKWLSSKKLYVEIKDDVTNRSQSRQKPLDGRIEEADDQNGDFIFIRR